MFFKTSRPCIDNYISAYLKYPNALISEASVVQATVKTWRLQMPLLKRPYCLENQSINQPRG